MVGMFMIMTEQVQDAMYREVCPVVQGRLALLRGLAINHRRANKKVTEWAEERVSVELPLKARSFRPILLTLC